MKQSKYQPLQDFLLSGNQKNYKLSFKQIEIILGFSLPTSARVYNPWWANENLKTTTHSHSKSWVGAGYSTQNLDFHNETVEFIKNRG